MNKKKDTQSFIRDALEERRKNHKFRTLHPVNPNLGSSIVEVGKRELINFCSNDYLGLSSHPKVIERAADYAKKYGAGSGASRLVSGTLTIHHEFEEKLAATLGLEAVLIFNSGFQANTTILPALTDRNSLILADKKCHNSLIQGALLSRADFRRFDHNDMGHLQKLLKEASSRNYNRVWVVSETVFSMDGDRSNLKSLIELSDEFGALFYSDDAHALGVLGSKGLGLNFDHPGIDISLGTFGKSFGAFGAFVGCSQEMKDYLINFCPGFIYTTALPPAVIGALEAALELIPEMESERKQLYQRISSLRIKIRNLGFDTGDSDSQIIPIVIGSEKETLSLSRFLEEQGIWASAIRPPTVEKKSSRIRITITACHTQQNIDTLLDALRRWRSR